MFETERPQDKREKRRNSFYFAEVTSVPSSGRSIVARPLGSDERPFGHPIAVPTKGDVALPRVGDIIAVIHGEADREAMVGVVYSGDTAPDFERGERVIGHRYSDSAIRIKRRGQIEIDAPFVYAPRREDDPTNAEDGAVWYNESEQEYKGVKDGNIVVFETSEET